jgi:hypothetical protein
MKTRKKTGSKNINKKDELRIKKARKKEGMRSEKNKTSKKSIKKTSKKDKPGIKRKRAKKNDETVKMATQTALRGEKDGHLLLNLGKTILLIAVLAAFWYFFDQWLGRK